MATETQIELSRKELYDRVWSTPMRTLATEFGLSDVGLAKVCKRHKIPRPTRGYWAKLEHGKAAEKWPLRAITDASLEVVRFNRCDDGDVSKVLEKDSIAADPEIAALIEAERLPGNAIHAATDLRGADDLVRATRESLAQTKADDYGRVSRRYDFQGTTFEVCVSKANVHRALLLLHSLVRAFTARGYSIVAKGDRQKRAGVELMGRVFVVSIWEPSRRQDRVPSKQEQQDAKKYLWMTPRRYEYVSSGVIEIHLDRDSYVSAFRLRDSKRKPLEQRLNEVIVAMLRTVDRERIAAEERRREAIEAENRKRAAIRKEVIRRSDKVREQRLQKFVSRWENATRIREFIDAVRQEELRRSTFVDEHSETGRWLAWADTFVERVNPLSGHAELPTYSLTADELEQLTRECESDWCNWSEDFRPRQPR